ncbi:MAG: hypothetical protein EA345_05580 [Halomonas sp.]|nr:hypothetical protein [Halomonas sp.]TVP50170.1 MAG: hypothetical protein EA345_05580 [Halomonas sp.]
MAERLTLVRQINQHAAKQRLQRLGARACEPAWVSLWTVGLGRPNGRPGAWLLCTQAMRRALLLVGAELPVHNEAPDTGIQIDHALPPPTPEALARLWLWERMATPRYWRIQVLGKAPEQLWLPCWLGYTGGRQHRLLVISGLSGEPLPMLKPVILRGLQQAHNNGQGLITSEQRGNSL